MSEEIGSESGWCAPVDLDLPEVQVKRGGLTFGDLTRRWAVLPGRPKLGKAPRSELKAYIRRLEALLRGANQGSAVYLLTIGGPGSPLTGQGQLVRDGETNAIPLVALSIDSQGHPVQQLVHLEITVRRTS